MSDLIDRQAALDAFGLSEKTRKYGGDHSGYDTRMLYEIQDTLESLPAAQPEIIRCKDCKYMIDAELLQQVILDVCLQKGERNE